MRPNRAREIGRVLVAVAVMLLVVVAAALWVMWVPQ